MEPRKRKPPQQRAMENRDLQLLAAIVDSSEDAIISKTLDGIITSWNPGAERIFGYRAEEVIGKSITILIPKERLSEEEMILRKIGRDERIEQFQTVRLRKDGQRIDISLTVSPVRDETGKVVGASKIARDITLLKRTMEARMFLASIVESSEDAVISKSLDGTITSWNRAAQRIFGYEAEEAIGKSILILIPPDRHGEETAILEKIRRGEHIGHYETLRMRKDGRLVPISVTVSPLKNPEGKIIGASKVARDISSRRATEDELRHTQLLLQEYTNTLEARVAERTARLEEMNQSLEGLSFSIAHDLRGPLRAVRGLTEILLEDYAPGFDDTGRDYANRIVRAAGKMEELINDLLSYGRLTRVDLPLTSLNTDLTVSTVLDNLREEIESKHAKIEVQRPLPPVVAHIVTLEQVLTNLLTNALKFVEPNRSPDIRIYAEKNDGFVRLNVRDTGLGVAPEYQNRIFRMFERLADPQKYPGTGIGLAIVQKGIERMGGRVGVESAAGKGSTFWIELPEDGAPAPAAKFPSIAQSRQERQDPARGTLK